ncbi:LD-carboxypeptidase [Spirillospora sp. NPDC047279]|uniref:S66 peptidase family protein n=1 Tax=Spirillospora sp. NPDC047279 TaxID=3155478 RepID=UPI0033E0BDFD
MSGGARGFARLRAGDRVAVVAPSGPVDPGRLEAGVGVLRDLGLDVVIGKHALDRVDLGGDEPVRDDRQRLAGTDADRAADLQDAWCDPGVRAVICARGGYGATRVLDHLDWELMARATAEAAAGGRGPALLHGSSDITALHQAFAARFGVTTAYGPMPAGFLAEAAGDDREASLASLRATWFGGGAAGASGAAESVRGTHALRPGTAEGDLTGGTLSLLTATLGTPYAPAPATGRVVLLEEVSEAPYRIDRMLTQLLQAGWFDGAAGVALGAWTDCGDPAEADAVVRARLGPLGVPILAGLPAGHGPRQLTLELGAPVRLDAGAGTLTPLTLQAPAGGAR